MIDRAMGLISTRTRVSALSFLLLCNLLPAHAQEEDLCPPSSRPIIVQAEGGTQDKRTHISADEAKIDSENLTTFTGNVKAVQSNKQLTADNVTYDRRTEEFEATGNVIFTTGVLQFQGDSASVNLLTNQGLIKNTKYFTGTVNGRGSATQIVLENKDRLVLEDASYTTCPPEAEAWKLSADKITLDNSTRQGTANSMVLEVSDIPIFYLPYIRFPIGEERMSGFLFPGFGVSSKHGTEINIPYYWNIAPAMDATITPHIMTDRGLMLETEFRYLVASGHGDIEMDYLPNDDVYKADRQKFTWNHIDAPVAGWSMLADYNYVSDIDYLDDFTGSLSTTSVTHLNRKGEANYNSNYFLFSGVLQDHQNISGEEPYKRVPQLRFNTRFSKDEQYFHYDLTSEMVSFDHKDQSKVTGERLKLSPFLSYDVHNDAGFFIPKLSAHHIQYNLDNVAVSQPQTPNVTIPMFSLDTGLFFERNTEIAGVPMLHTIEPRLFYLYVPYKDQSNLPVFDTALTTFSQSLLFSENRFSGNDRIGDANQLTTALTTRFYRKSDGTELFSATLGQIIYFRDRTVTLPGETVETDDRSSYLGAINFNPHRNWRLKGDIQWEPETDHTEVGNARIQYLYDKGRIVNMDYRFRRNELRSQGLSLAWRINPRWQVFAGHLYDLENEHGLEDFLGVRYDSCCWGMRIVGKKQFDTLVGTEPRFENAVYLEFELKGLSSLGSRKDIDTALKNGILGYSE